MPAGKVHDGVHLAGDAGIVHDAEYAGLFGDGGLDLRLVDIHGVGANVDKDELCAGEREGGSGAGEGKARQNNFVTGLKLAQKRRHVERARAAGGQQNLLRVKALFKPFGRLAGEFAVTADFPGIYGLLDIFKLVSGARRDVEVYHSCFLR